MCTRSQFDSRLMAFVDFLAVIVAMLCCCADGFGLDNPWPLPHTINDSVFGCRLFRCPPQFHIYLWQSFIDAITFTIRSIYFTMWYKCMSLCRLTNWCNSYSMLKCLWPATIANRSTANRMPPIRIASKMKSMQSRKLSHTIAFDITMVRRIRALIWAYQLLNYC